ncbi:unnamed protein product [Mytilus coruscus]|uniref:Phytanoyl-CoA hydroxylase-interacting protein-like C-terminal domain-containing protein n=1 Tax=Mytilus coruscus TaxID=42192 RepID=A0A6J8CA95_MYTCO|nr:unnamed protein product [Mytilus coruscus]
MAFILHIQGFQGHELQDFSTWPLYFPNNVQAIFYLVSVTDNNIVQHQLVDLPKYTKDVFLEIKTASECGPVTMQILGLEKFGEGVQTYYTVVAEGTLDIVKEDKDTESTERDEPSSVTLDRSTGDKCAEVLFGLKNENGPDVQVSHKHGSRYWVKTPSSHEEDHYTQKIILLQHMQNQQLYLIFTQGNWSFKSIPFILQPGKEYRCIVIYSTYNCNTYWLDVGSMTDNNNNGVCLPEELRPHNLVQVTKEKVTSIYFTKQELNEMRLKAIEFVHRREQRVAAIPYFYRNKSINYFDSIMMSDSDGIMYPNLKDNNGDRYSIVNENIEGIFFSALLLPSTLKPPKTSIFGTRRLYVRSTLLLNEDVKMYFADFYCYNNVVHYVTIVLTKPGSESDQFCDKNLVQLNAYSNPFLQLTTIDGVQKVLVTLNAVIEIFYTEPIDLMAMSLLPGASMYSDVQLAGRGSSVEGGIPKKDDCDLCNVRTS